MTGDDGCDGHGMVEFFQRGRWRSVCNVTWGVEEAKVVCKELGLPSKGTHTSHCMHDHKNVMCDVGENYCRVSLKAIV